MKTWAESVEADRFPSGPSPEANARPTCCCWCVPWPLGPEPSQLLAKWNSEPQVLQVITVPSRPIGLRLRPNPLPEVLLPLPLLLPLRPLPRKTSTSSSDIEAKKAPELLPRPLPLLWPFAPARFRMKRRTERVGLPIHCLQAALDFWYAQKSC